MADESVGEAEAIKESTENVAHDENGERNVNTDSETAAGSDNLSMSSNASWEGLRRMSGKIANLRAAFERTDSGPADPVSIPRRLDRSPSVYKDHDAIITRVKEQHSQEIAKMREELEADVLKVEEHRQQEILQLKDQIEKEMDLRHDYAERCTSLEDEIDALRSQLSTQSAQHQADTALHYSERIQAQEEASRLQRQIYDLKHTIASTTRIDNQVSDSTFSQDFQNLFHATQNWVVHNYRRVKVEKSPEAMVSRLESIAESKQLDHLRPIYNQFDSSIKIAAFQATAACYMMEIWEEPLLFGLPTQQDWRKSLRRATETLPSVLPPVTFNKWRASTLETLRQTDKMSESMDSAVASLSEMICITLNTLTDAEATDAKLSSLNTIVQRAATLSHQFKVQRAQYEFRLPASGDAFASGTMEDVSIDLDPIDGRIVQCAIFPSVLKLGDENGDNIEMSNVIMKAKVICKG